MYTTIKWYIFMLMSFFVLGLNFSANSATLSWNRSPGDVEGYRVYYGTAPGSYKDSIDVGDKTELSLGSLGLSQGLRYYFAVKSYRGEEESTFSIEHFWEPGDEVPPLPPMGFMIE